LPGVRVHRAGSWRGKLVGVADDARRGSPRRPVRAHADPALPELDGRRTGRPARGCPAAALAGRLRRQPADARALDADGDRGAGDRRLGRREPRPRRMADGHPRRVAFATMLWERLLRRLSYRWLLGAVVVLLLAINVGWAASHSPAAVTVPLSVAATLSLLALPRFPVTVLGIQIGYLVIADLGFGSSNPFGLWVALCSVAAVRPRRVSLGGAFAALL